MTATEAALYDQRCSGDLWDDMNSLTHKNLPLSIFLEYADLGFPTWGGSRTERTSNANIISSLGIGIVKFAEQRVEVDDPADCEYRVDVSRGSTSQTYITARIVDPSDNPPPDPKATDTKPGYSIPSLPSNSQRTTASWGVWSCYWVPPVYPEEDDEEGEVIPGYWAYRYSWYSARITQEIEGLFS